MDFIVEYYFDFGRMADQFGPVLDGFYYTVKLSLLGGALALVWGLVLAILRQLPGGAAAPVRWVTIAYIDVFRGIPLLLVLVLTGGFLSAAASPVGGEIIPRSLGVPDWFGQPSPFWYGIIALTLTYGAYMAEVYRAGIEAVPSGQTEAARSLGMSHGQSMRYIVVPQAIRKVIPPLLNDFIALMKDTSLVAFLGLVEVVQAGQNYASDTFNGSALVLGGIMFLLVTIPLARFVDYLIARDQKRTQRGSGDGGGKGGDNVIVPQPNPGGGGLAT